MPTHRDGINRPFKNKDFHEWKFWKKYLKTDKPIFRHRRKTVCFWPRLDMLFIKDYEYSDFMLSGEESILLYNEDLSLSWVRVDKVCRRELVEVCEL